MFATLLDSAFGRRIASFLPLFPYFLPSISFSNLTVRGGRNQF
jgi:hypothetical protein